MKPFKNYRSQVTTCRKEYKLITNGSFDMYWDEGWSWYPKKSKKKQKTILSYQVRQYRSWKYNRKTQWKCSR